MEDPGYPEVDPLLETAGWRERVSSPEGLREALRAYAAVKNRTAAERWRDTAEYVDRYSVAVDEASIERFMIATGLENGQPAR